MALTKAARRLRVMVEPSTPPYTREEIATACGVSVSAISEWVRGKSVPRPEHIKKLAELGIPVAEWFEDAGA